MNQEYAQWYDAARKMHQEELSILLDIYGAEARCSPFVAGWCGGVASVLFRQKHQHYQRGILQAQGMN